MKTVTNLLKATGDKTLGNHRVQCLSGNRRAFVYHNTVICFVDDSKRTFHTQNGGWSTQSTTRAINAYTHELKSRGYTNIN